MGVAAHGIFVADRWPTASVRVAFLESEAVVRARLFDAVGAEPAGGCLPELLVFSDRGSLGLGCVTSEAYELSF